MRGLFSVAVLVVTVATATALVPTSRAGRSPICTRGLTTVERDPRNLLPLTANPIGPAVRAALRYTRPSARPQVTSADLAAVDHSRGSGAKSECGTRVWRRTVVVYVTLRAFEPSASLSENVFYVGRFRGGYRVWQVVH
ncbi:MAG TPA: hypothetical protein VKR79_04315 [Gaiellaceae bacterium]|nr:hypothetical protein [Gaiellaceae bacterium]